MKKKIQIALVILIFGFLAVTIIPLFFAPMNCGIPIESSHVRALCVMIHTYAEEKNEFPLEVEDAIDMDLSKFPDLKEFIERKEFVYTRPETPPSEADSTTLIIEYKDKKLFYKGYYDAHVERLDPN